MGRLGKAMTRENILSATEVFGLNREEAGAIFSRMAAHVASSWEDAFMRHGMAQSELTLLAQCFSLACSPCRHPLLPLARKAWTKPTPAFGRPERPVPAGRRRRMGDRWPADDRISAKARGAPHR